jgi:hypothetical protein
MMRVTLKRAALAAGAVAATFAGGGTAEAQGWSPQAGYFHTPAGRPLGLPGCRPRYSLYSPGGYGWGMSPYSGYEAGRPPGGLEYDVYTPYGRQEWDYKYRRNGRIGFGIFR